MGSKPSLTYPFDDAIPDRGEATEVAEGVLWVRMPLPMSLDHINLYLLEADEGWWIVDTGMKWGDMRERWQDLFDGPMKGKPVQGVIATHMHPDHLGMAGWLCETWRVPFYTSFGEYYQARSFSKMTKDDLSWTSEEYYRKAGMPQSYIDNMRDNFSGFGSVVEPLPGAFRRMQEGDTLYVGKRGWQIMIGRGHSPEHVCLYSASDKIIISGDQIIPKITSNISVMAAEPGANPLGQWFKSLRRFSSLPPDTLVLPAHNTPFVGVRQRLQYLIEHHEAHLAALEEACRDERLSAKELLPVLFKREINPHEMGMALGECVAHLNYLSFAGRMARELDAEGAWRYETVDPAEYQGMADILVEAPPAI